MCFCDADGWITGYNAAAVRLWGREPEPGRERWCGALRAYRTDGKALPIDERAVAGLLRTGRWDGGEEILIEREDGTRRSVIEFPELLRDETGAVTGAVNVLVDVTDLHAKEERIRDSELKFRTLAERAPVGIFLSAPNGEALFVNSYWCRMAGMEREEALGDGWMEAIHPDDLSRVTSAWEQAVGEHSPSESEFRFLKPDGSVTWIQGSAQPLLDPMGGFAGYIGCCVDITDRKRSEETLARITVESERKRRLYDGLLSTTPDLAYVFDLNGRFIYANAAVLEMWGKTWTEAAGKNCLELGYEPWHAAMHDREIAEVIRTKHAVRGEVPFPHESKGVRIYDYIFAPVLGDDGEVEAIAGTTRDVTERKHAEERAEFLSQLTGGLVRLKSGEEIAYAVVEAVGRKLGAQQCFFAECLADAERVVVMKSWSTEGSAEISGSFRFDEFGDEEWWSGCSRGSFVVHQLDVDSSPSEALRRFGVSSCALHSLKAEEGRFAILAVTSGRSRTWTLMELSLIEQAISRAWPLVERARSELAMRESRVLLRSVSDHLPALISYLDRNEIFRFANRGYCDWFGYPIEQIEGMSLRELLHEDAYRERKPYLARVLRGEHVKFEGQTLHRELGWRDVELTYAPDFDPESGEVRGFHVMVLDISERKKAERLLERQALRLRLLWEAAGVMLRADDPDLMLQQVFGKIRSLLEVDAFFHFVADESGKGLSLLSCSGISEETRKAFARLNLGEEICGSVALRREPMVFSSIQESSDPRVQGVKALGVRAVASNPLVAGDELLGTLSFASRTRDSFDQDEIEFMQTIAHYVTGACARLRLVGNLRAADRRKDEFLATLAHELRNPLAPIRTGLEVMKLTDEDRGLRERLRVTMERQVEQLVTLVDDLLDVSRITRGKLQLKKSRVNLADAIRTAVEASQSVIEEAGHHLEVNLPDEPVFLEADPHRLSQVVSNLLNNAAKYTERGGSIALKVMPEDDAVTVRVSDNGVGIPAGMLERIFEMFAQIDPCADGGYGGLGIGLTLVKSLVEMHGGRVWAESAGPGKGTTVSFRLPLPAEAGRECDAGAGESKPAGGGRLKVLVVDDNQAAADMLAMAIEFMGHEVKVASNGEEGVRLAEDFRPAAVLMDLGMPVLDGWEAARRIRSREWGKTMTLVALTGWGQEEDRKRTMEAGFDHHLVKPAGPDAIRRLLAQCG